MEQLKKGVVREKQIDPFGRRAMRPRTLWVMNKSSASSTQQGAEESKGSNDHDATGATALARQVSTNSTLSDNLELRDDGGTQLTDDVIELRYGFNPSAVPPVHARPLGNRFSSIALITDELPPPGSEAREKLRKQLGGMSLAEYFEQTGAAVH